MNTFKLSLLTFVFSLCIATGCSNSSSNKVDLDKVLKIMSDTLTKVEGKQDTGNEQANMDLFIIAFHKKLNQASPRLHPQSIGVKFNADGSVYGYNDKNSNNIQESGENQLFKVEIDGENNRLLASENNYVRERGFSGSGIFTGLLIGSMLSRQRTAGVNPSSLSSKKSSAKRSASSQKSSSKTSSAKSRSRSGSFSRGK